MALTKVTIVHDILGRLVSISRPAKAAKVVVLPPEGHSIFVTDIDSENIKDLIHTHIVDTVNKSLVPLKKPPTAK